METISLYHAKCFMPIISIWNILYCIDWVPALREKLCKLLVSSVFEMNHYLSLLMGKATICICENKDADQLREADQRLCFRYSDRTILLLLKSEISSFKLFSLLVHAG